jgi:sulfopyruvate decarboxylase subunit beta
MLKRDECLQALARHRTDEIVVAVYKAAEAIIQLSPSDLNYTFTGAMGQGSSHALGLALGRPDKRVIVLDGDGSLLMNLGTLVTIANAAPPNLLHFLCHNGTYETNGAVPIPNQARTDFPALAKAAGYRSVHSFEEQDAWEQAIPELLRAEGPIFVDLRMVPGETQFPEDFKRLYAVESREAFRRALAAQPVRESAGARA